MAARQASGSARGYSPAGRRGHGCVMTTGRFFPGVASISSGFRGFDIQDGRLLATAGPALRGPLLARSPEPQASLRPAVSALLRPRWVARVRPTSEYSRLRCKSVRLPHVLAVAQAAAAAPGSMMLGACACGMLIVVHAACGGFRGGWYSPGIAVSRRRNLADQVTVAGNDRLLDSYDPDSFHGTVSMTMGHAHQRSADPAASHLVFRAQHLGGGLQSELTQSMERGNIAGIAADPARLDGQWQGFYDQLFELHNLEAGLYRSSVLERRKSACLRAIRAVEVTAAHARIAADPMAAERALQAVMIGVTSFWRDPPVFQALAQVLESSQKPLSVLSVGCSDGAELYSVAMLLAELGIEPAGLLGVDCRGSAIQGARLATYPDTYVRNLPEHLQRKYLLAVPAHPRGAVQVTAALRDRCQWVVANIFNLSTDHTFDLILCRNLSIYLAPDAAVTLSGILFERLAAGGILVLGKAERPATTHRLERLAPCIYRKERRPC
jgi:chemotaxis protein methyltransferase CheR